MSFALLRLAGCDMIKLGGSAASTPLDSRCPGAAVPLLDRLTPERARKIIGTFGHRPLPKKPRTSESRSAPRPRARSPLALYGPTDGTAERNAAGVLPGNQDLDGAGHMEMHWAADDGERLSTFVGGSQAAEAEHCTAFGRDIGAEVGLQFLDSASRAYRIMVARSFKNDLDVPVQGAKFQFELNVRF